MVIAVFFMLDISGLPDVGLFFGRNRRRWLIFDRAFLAGFHHVNDSNDSPSDGSEAEDDSSDEQHDSIVVGCGIKDQYGNTDGH